MYHSTFFAYLDILKNGTGGGDFLCVCIYEDLGGLTNHFAFFFLVEKSFHAPIPLFRPGKSTVVDDESL